MVIMTDYDSNLDFLCEKAEQAVKDGDIPRLILVYQEMWHAGAWLALARIGELYETGYKHVDYEFKKDLDQRNYRVSNEKIESYGWIPNFSLESGIEELIGGYQQIVKQKNKDFTNM